MSYGGWIEDCRQWRRLPKGIEHGLGWPIAEVEVELVEIAEGPDLRLGWLESFVAVAGHLSYKDALTDLGLSSASSAQHAVTNLQGWLHKLLIWGDDPLELTDDGQQFLSVAAEIVVTYEDCHAKVHGREPEYIPSLRRSSRSDVTLSDLENLLAVAEHHNYKKADMGNNPDGGTSRRKLRFLEREFGKLMVGGWDEVKPTETGKEVLAFAQRTVDLLRRARNNVSGDYITSKSVALGTQKLVARERRRLAFEISLVEKEGKKLYARAARDFADAKKRLEFLDKFHESMAACLGPLPSGSAEHIDMDHIIKTSSATLNISDSGSAKEKADD